MGKSKSENTTCIRTCLWICLAITIILAAGMNFYGGSYFSPFISLPQQTISPLNQWAKNCFEPEQINYFFGLDAIFAFSLCCLQYFLFKIFTRQENSETDIDETVTNKLNEASNGNLSKLINGLANWLSKHSTSLFLLLIVYALIFDWIEGISFTGNLMEFAQDAQSVKMFFYYSVWIILLFFGIEYSIKQFNKKKEDIQ